MKTTPARWYRDPQPQVDGWWLHCLLGGSEPAMSIVRAAGSAYWSTPERNHCSSLRCEICDRPPLRAEYQQHADGWEVVHWPGRAEWLRLPFSETLARPPPVGVRIMTCGDEVCVFRARVHGVPGAVYRAACEGP